jgi:hypothetical protein
MLMGRLFFCEIVAITLPPEKRGIMKKLLYAVSVFVVALWLSPSLTEAQSLPAGSTGSDTGGESINRDEKIQNLDKEVKLLQEGLEVKQAELAKLRHRWMVNKGRTPSADEIKDFEAKRAKGEDKLEDNPYVNKNALSSPSRWRAAYYEKLAEINKDKERLNLLEQELDSLKR